MVDLKKLIRDIPDFPKPGIIFKDITPLLADPLGLKASIDNMAAPFRELSIDHVVGIESRGFMFGPAIALALGAGFVPIRKPGKLPYKTRKVDYELEYGLDQLEVHEDAVGHQERVLVVDDVLATGGTAEAAQKLLLGLGAEIVGFSFLIELAFLNGRNKLPGANIHSALHY